jgi:hypothetical protein
VSNFVGFASAAGDTVSVPSHSNGDLLVIMAHNTASATVPSTPSGFTSVTGGASTYGSRTAQRVSDGTVSSVVATNATGIAVWVLTSPDATPIGGASAWATWSGRTSLSIPSITLADADGSSWRLSGSLVEGTGLTFASLVGQSVRGSFESGGFTYVFLDAAGVTAGSGDNATITPSSTYNNRSASLEVRLVPVSPSGPTPAAIHDYLTLNRLTPFGA